MVFVIGLPIFFAELVVGQFSGLGPNKAYARMAPFFSGNYFLKKINLESHILHNNNYLF